MILIQKPLTTFAILFLLWGSVIPSFGAIGALGYCVLAAALTCTLVKWGPKLNLSQAWCVAFWASLAIFCASLISGGAGSPRNVAENGLTLSVVMALWLWVTRSVPTTRRSHFFRILVIASSIAFAVSADWWRHTSLVLRRGGDHYSLLFPHFSGGALGNLSNPYDIYLVYYPGRIMVLVSCFCVVLFSMLYFVTRHAATLSDQRQRE